MSTLTVSRFPASFAQRRLWFIHQFDPRSAAYNMVVSTELPMAGTPELVQCALDQLCAYRETLRTSFVLSDGDVVQEIHADSRIEMAVHSLPSNQAITAIVSAAATEPFVLEHAPLARAHLALVSGKPSVLVLILHHIIADGISLQILLNDLHGFISSLLDHRTIRLTPLPIEYADYAVWQRRMLVGKRLHTLTNYWRQRLDGMSLLQLPTRRAGRSGQRGCVVAMELEPALCGRLRAFAVKLRTTVFAVLLAGFCVLLGRFSGQHDFGIGIPVSGRNRVEFEHVAGLFINSVVFRARLSPGVTFTNLVQQTAALLADDLSHQEMPFELLVEALRVKRSADQNPLFQVMLQLQMGSPAPRGCDGSSSESPNKFDPEGLSSQLDLSAMFFDLGEGGIRGGIVYGADLFEQSWIEQLATAYRVMLNEALSDPDQPCEHLPLLNEPSRRLLLAMGEGRRESWPKETLLHDGFHVLVQQRPDAVAVCSAHGMVSFGELEMRVKTLTERLHDLGVGPNDTVALCTQRSIGMISAMIATLRCGAAYLSIDPAVPEARRLMLLKDSCARVVIVSAGGAAMAGGLSAIELNSVGDITPDVAVESVTGRRPSPQSAAYLIYTSGSTGKPKGVRIPHSSIVNHMRWILTEFEINSTDRILQRTPTSFDASVWEIWAPLLSGATLVLADTDGPFDPAQLGYQVRTNEITILQVVPSLLRALLPCCVKGDLRTLRLIFCGGEPLDAGLVRAVKNSCEAKIVNLYGPSETTIDATYYVCTNGSVMGNDIPIGRPIANVSARVLDENLELLPWGVKGELCIGGLGVGLGYQQSDELTSKHFVPDPFVPGERIYRSGDIAYMGHDGTLHYVGRRDGQIKLRGFRIELGEIEMRLKAHEAVAEAAAAVQQLAIGDQRLIAFASLRSDRTSVTSVELLMWLRAVLPAYAVPSTVMIVESFPLMENGKIDRVALCTKAVIPERTAGFRGEQCSTLQRRICDSFARLLVLDHVDISDDFFQLGGHSMLVIELCEELKRTLGISVSVVDVFEFPTPRQLAEALEGRSGITDFQAGSSSVGILRGIS